MILFHKLGLGAGASGTDDQEAAFESLECLERADVYGIQGVGAEELTQMVYLRQERGDDGDFSLSDGARW